MKNSHVCLADFNTFALNSITGVRSIEKTPGRGAGIITLRNSVVWANTTQLLVEPGGVIAVSYSAVEGTPPPGPGNISLDPLFVDPATGDFHLRAGSPCIGAAEGGKDMGALAFEVNLLPPADLKVELFSFDALAVSWRDNSSLELGFEVERAVGGGGFELLATLPGGFPRFAGRRPRRRPDLSISRARLQ